MMLGKKDALYSLVILNTSLIAVIITLTTSSPTFHVGALWSLVLVAIIISKFDLLHPYFWFSTCFALYASAYAILTSLGYRTYTGYTYENILLPILALATTLLVIGPKRNKSTQLMFTEAKIQRQSIDAKILKGMLILLCLILIIAVGQVSRLGIQKKAELVAGGYLSFRIAVYSIRFISLYCGLYILFCGKDGELGFIPTLCTACALLFTFLTAERDGIFRFLLIWGCSLFAIGRVTRKGLPVFTALGVAVLLVVSYLKYYFVRGTLHTAFVGNNILYNVLTSDFSAAGENMQVLINNTWTKAHMDYSQILNDLVAPFAFGPIRTFNLSTWFNDTFYYGSYSRAFTLVGEGYVIGGYVGVMVLFILVGVIVKFMYRNSHRNEYWFIAYIYSIATVVSSFRGTLSGVLVDMFRVVLVGIVGYRLLSRILRTSRGADLNRKAFQHPAERYAEQ